MSDPIIYKNDYREEFEAVREQEARQIAEVENISEYKAYFRSLDARLDQIPYAVVPEGKETYDRLLCQADRIAKESGGSIYGIVDEKNGEARIDLTLPWMMFFCNYEMAFLQDVAASAEMLFFEAVGHKNNIQMSIQIRYFEKAMQK